MKITKFISLCLVFVILVFAFSACGHEEILTKTFTYGEFSIVLPRNFSEDQEIADENARSYFIHNITNTEFFTGVIESKYALAAYGYENISLYDYALMVKNLYGVSSALENKDSIYYLVYEGTWESFDFKYLTCFYENDNNFFSVTYYTYLDLFDLDKGFSYMDGVSF